jgi:Glycosyl transferase family 2
MFERVNKTKVDIFLRVFCPEGIDQQLSADRKRCVNDLREPMILKCVKTLVSAIENSKHDCRLWIIDDQNPESFLQKLDSIIQPLPYTIVRTEQQGFVHSAKLQGELALKNGREFIYFVEDDYIHCPDAIDLMVSGMETLVKSSNNHPVAIYPYDCIDRYRKEFPGPCRIFYQDGLYWRTVTKSTQVLMIHHQTYSNVWPVFRMLFENYNPYVFGEDHSINQLWSNMVDFGQKIVLFSPIPSLAVHLEHQEPTVIENGIVNWREFWNQLEI